MKKIIFTAIFIFLVMLMFQYAPVKKSAARMISMPANKIEVFLSKSGSKIGSYFSFIGSITKLRAQNEELTQKLLSLEVDRSKLSELEYENTLLKKEIGFMGEQKDTVLVPARIIGREPVAFLDTFIIDKGTDDGITIDSAVISGGALVGQITEVYQNSAKVTMITSKDSIILAMLQNSRAKGILRGGISGLMLEDITQDVEYVSGEFVTTSGLDGKLKPGILIGRINETKSTSSGLFKTIPVEPSADLSKLELVFILQ